MSNTFTTELPCGILQKDGTRTKEVEMYYLTGRMRREVINKKNFANPAKLKTNLLGIIIERVGTNERPSGKLIREMTTPDRSYLMLQISKSSLGDTIEVETDCQKCQEKFSFTYKLDRDTCPLPEGLQKWKETNFECFELEFGSHKWVFRIPNGIDEEHIVPVAAEEPDEAMQMMLSRCLLSMDGQEDNSAQIIGDMRIKDLDELTHAFEDKLPGPKLLQSARCPNCRYVTDTQPELTDFLFSKRTGIRSATKSGSLA